MKLSKRILAVALAMLVALSPVTQGQTGTSGSSKQERAIARTKAAVAQAQTANQPIEVKSQNGDKFRGNVAEVNAEGFTLVCPSQGSHKFAYSDISKVKAMTNPLSGDINAKRENKVLKVLKWMGLGAGFVGALFLCSQMGCRS